MKAHEIDVQAIMHLENLLQAIEVLPAYRIKLQYADGSEYILDFTQWMNSGVMVGLKDPGQFARAAISEGGRALEFPGGIDFCADSLRVDAELQLAAGR